MSVIYFLSMVVKFEMLGIFAGPRRRPKNYSGLSNWTTIESTFNQQVLPKRSANIYMKSHHMRIQNIATENYSINVVVSDQTEHRLGWEGDLKKDGNMFCQYA